MRSQVIDMVGYAGDITTAKERLGIGSALIMVKGGTSGTAIKVVTCSTSNGDFTDYVTLEAEGSSDLVKGYYVNLNGADKYIKVTGAKFADVVFGDCNFDPKGIEASGTVPVTADLENNKTATINASTYTAPVEITPSEGKDGMKKATVTLSNIPSGGASKLYAWTSENHGWVYTGTETPSVGDKCFSSSTDIGDMNDSALIISAVSENSITTGEDYVYERTSSEDVNL